MEPYQTLPVGRTAAPLVVSLREHGIGAGDAGLGSDEAAVTFEVSAAVKAP